MSGLETWSLPLASPNGATACSQRLQPGRSYVADWCIVFFQFQCCNMSSNLLLAEPENSRNSADSTTGGTQLHKTTLASQGGGCRRERATGKWGTDKHTCQASSTARSERTQERKLLASLCGHRPPLAFTWWVDVPSIQWYFRGHGRTSPDLELCANRCAIFH